VTQRIRDFTSSVRTVGEGRKLPSAGSPTMREISSESDWAKRSGWDAPFADTHSLAELTLRAATDYAHTFADTFNTERAPIYGHLVLARSALESSGICWWLSEPGIARDERIKRGLSEYIYSAVEEQSLDLVPDAAQHVAAFIDHATQLGWQVEDHNQKRWSSKSRGKPRVDGVGRPAGAAGIASLLTDDQTSKIGDVQWSRLSAVSHVTFWGLRSAFDDGGAVSDPISGRAEVPIGTDARSVSLQAVCMLKALRRAADATFELMGWRDDEWSAAAMACENLERQLLDALKPHLSTMRP
jgi:hypothetical protein